MAKIDYQKYFDELHPIAQDLHPTRWLTPTNLESELHHFKTDNRYEPQFTYPSIPLTLLASHLHDLNHIKLPQSNQLEYQYLSRKIKELELKYRLALTTDPDERSQVSIKLYQCTFTPAFIKQAQQEASLPGSFGSLDTASSDKAHFTITNYLHTLGIIDWTVDIGSYTGFNFRVLPQKRRILINKLINWDFSDLDNTLAHEIDGHVLRAVNMHRQTNPLFARPWPFYLKTEEGLASFLGDYSSKTATISRKHHALKYLAGHFALTHSFSQTYSFLIDHGLTPQLAFRRTFRLKRGFTNTSQPGCHAQEPMYYEGMLEVKNYFENGGDPKMLYIGKVSLEDAHLFPTPPHQLIPERLQSLLIHKRQLTFESQ